jgi:1-phosphofructokinase
MILTVTFNPAVDHTAVVDEDLEEGRVARGHDAVFDAAGKGINVAKYLTGLDHETIATGPVAGFLGRFIEQDLDGLGVEHDFIRIEGLTRLNTLIDAPDAEYKVNMDGPQIPDGLEDRLLHHMEIHDPDIVVMGGSLPPGMDESVIERMADGDWRAVLDVHGDVLSRQQGDFFLAKPNRAELAEATGMPCDTDEEVLEAADALREQGIENVLVSLGPEGAIYVTGGGAFRADALDVEVADTVGAGDAAVAGALDAVEKGESDRSILKKALAAASRVVSISGVGMPDFEELDATADRVEVERLR